MAHKQVHNDDISNVLILNKKTIAGQESQLFEAELEKLPIASRPGGRLSQLTSPMQKRFARNHLTTRLAILLTRRDSRQLPGRSMLVFRHPEADLHSSGW